MIGPITSAGDAMREGNTMDVYRAINAVQSDLARVGISKDGVNSSQNYKFRGIDQVYAALAPLLAKHGLCVLPRVISHERSERVTLKPGYQGGPAKESVLFYVTVDVEFDFVAMSDGSKHVVRTAGEAMDSGDKATNKAMSAAYKYAAFMAFAIPTEGDNDADAHTHEVQPRKTQSQPASKKVYTGPYKTKTALWAAVRAFDRELRGCGDIEQLEGFLGIDESKALLKQCDDEEPALSITGEGMPDEFVPLRTLIAKMRSDLELGVDPFPVKGAEFVNAG